MDTVWVLVALGAILLGLATVVGLYLSRQRTLSSRVGSFPCSIKATSDGDDSTWTPGIAQYATGRLVWWRTFSLAPRPERTWSRAELVLLERTDTGQSDERGNPLVVVRCRHQSDSFVLTMTSGACAGLVSWLESGPRPLGRVI